jgi:hypothetical protein
MYSLALSTASSYPSFVKFADISTEPLNAGDLRDRGAERRSAARLTSSAARR